MFNRKGADRLAIRRVLPVFITAFVAAACEHIPYNENVAKTVSEYGTVADRHIVAVGTEWQKCFDAMPEKDQKQDRAAIRFDVLRSALLSVTEKNTLEDAVAEVMKSDDLVAKVAPYLVGAQGAEDIKNRLLEYAGLKEKRPELTAAERNALVVKEISDNIGAGEKLRNDCTKAAYESFAGTFYDDWSSRLFTTQQQAPAGDILGICEKAGKLAKEHAAKVADKVLKTALTDMKFDDTKSCTLGTICGVIVQHENLRALHKRRIVIDRDNGKFWRDTIAQSVRLALTVENFKKSAAEDAADPL